MKTRAILALTAAAGLAGVANAQETAQYIIGVSAATISPGQSVNVSVSASYAPGVGANAVWNTLGGTGQTGTVAGFSLAVFNLLGNAAAGVSGSWSNLVIGPGFSPFANAGTIAGNNVNGAEIGTGFGPPLATAPTTNPVLLWTGTWTASAASGVGAMNLTASALNGGLVHIWLQGGTVGAFASEDAWGVTNGQGTFSVIPAPASLALLGLGGLVAARRRR
ncbi:MAG: PEP-CTERM sorting domain-containing protein [Phycisphaerales bacterium]